MKYFVAFVFSLFAGINLICADTTVLRSEDIVCTAKGNIILIENKYYDKDYRIEVKSIGRDLYNLYKDNRCALTVTSFELRHGIGQMLQAARVSEASSNEEFEKFLDLSYRSITEYFGLNMEAKEVSLVKELLSGNIWLYLSSTKDISFLKDNYTTHYYFNFSGRGESYYGGSPDLREKFTWSYDGKNLTLVYGNSKTETIKNLKIIDPNTITGIKGNDKTFRLIKKSSVEVIKGENPGLGLFPGLFF